MFNPRTFENARPDGFPVLEIVPSPGEPGEQPQPRLFVPLQRTDLAGEVVGPVAALRLAQHFLFTREQCPRIVEACYRFPLPGDAAVTGVRVRFGEVEIAATLAERADAERTYQAARDEGRQAALLTRESPDVFTLQVAGLAPDTAVVIETSYAQLARPEGDGWSLRVPLTTAPRYVRADERGSAHADGQPLALLRDPGHRFALDLRFEGVEAVTSETHTLALAQEDGRLRVLLAGGEVLPDRDCVLTWQPRRVAQRPLLQVLRGDEPAHAATCVLALVSPPAAPAGATAIPREVILLIDHSGSMEGPKWEAADWAVQNLLAGLTPADTFNLGLFHNTTRWFVSSPVRGDARTLEQARAFLLRHRDSGGTELGVALEQALGQPRGDDDRSRHVLIVTDAEVSDAGRILTLVEREAARPERRRVDVLCIDAAPNSGLALELAERGGGIARFLTSDPDENDIASALDEVLADWAAPMLHNLTLEVDHPAVQAAGRRVRAQADGRSSIDLGDLPAGRAVWVAARIVGERTTPLTMRLLADGDDVVTEQADAAEGAAGRPAVAALFGARRVLDLELAQTSGQPVEERLRQLGYDPAEVLAAGVGAGAEGQSPPLYAENARASTTDALRALLVRESLRYGIACSATAFVAERQEAGQRVEGTVAVANALPHGWSDRFLMPRYAMSAGARSMTRMGSAPMPLTAAPAAPPPADAAFMAHAPATGDVFADEDMPAFLRSRPDDASTQVPPAPGRGKGRGFDLGGIVRRFGKRASGGGGGGVRPLNDAVEQPGQLETGQPAGGSPVVFAGVPRFDGGEAVLFDSRTSSGRLPQRNVFSRLRVRLSGGSAVDAGLVLVLYVDDLAAPRARVRLVDLLRQGGERPLNVRYEPGQVVRLVLLDSAGAWAGGAHSLEVVLS